MLTADLGYSPIKNCLGHDSSQQNMHKSQHVKMPKLQSASIPSKCCSAAIFPQSRDPLLKSHQKISEVRLFLRNFFCVHKILKLTKNFHQKKNQAEQRGPGRTIGLQPAVVLNVANLPELGRRFEFVTSIKPQRRFHESLCGSRKKPRVFFNAHTRLIEMTSGPYDGYSL